jgi:carboxylesterase type B/ribulose-5-phosphate 4-epimerase/fuculose-1-phosphate aldolase
MTVGATSEDCLTVNVWTPVTNGQKPAPVMVWFHGGAFVLGGSSLETYDPARLVAEQRVVVVSANYRLGALGFLTSTDGDGRIDANCGLLDQLLVLRWVADNIAAFGGDPGRVTIFGESAGAGSVLHLLASAQSRGLISGAIIQSPGVRQTLTADRAELVAKTFLDKLGVTPSDTSALAEVPVERILAAQAETSNELLMTIGSMPFHPAVDGKVLVETPLESAKAGRIHSVPVMAGTTAEEMRLFADPVMAQFDRATLTSILGPLLSAELARPVPAEAVDAVVGAYEDQANDGRDVFAGVATDVIMRLPLAEFLDAYTRSGAEAFAYSFTWRGAVADRDVGACHAMDLPFTFGTLDRAGWDAFTGAGVDNAAAELSAVMRAAWASFARTGIPEVTGPVSWPRYTPAERQTLVLGRNIDVVPDPLADARRRCAPVTTPARVGGVAKWAPRIMPGIGRDLSLRQELACAFRILAETGFSENLAGHITMSLPGTDHLLINPWGKWWEELSASDLCEITADGEVVDGPWDVTPAIHIHTELHRSRQDARVVVHNHPYYCTVLAAVGVLPEILHQTGSMFDGDLGFVHEYTGEIDEAELGRDLAERIGEKSVVVLANHGVIVTAPTIREAVYRSASFDRMCRLTYDTMLLGRDPLPIAPELRSGLKSSLLERGADVYWEGAVRMLLRTQPDVLD